MNDRTLPDAMQRKINFADLPPEYADPEQARIVIIPVPYDKTVTWLKGAEAGPRAIIEASAHLELYDIETDCEVYKAGIYTNEPVSAGPEPQDMVEAVRARTAEYINRDKFTVVLGGEHLVSLGAIRAHCQREKNLTVLQLDAHCDLRDEYNGSKYNHACVMARVRDFAPVVQVGIRSMDISEKAYIEPENIFFAEDIYRNDRWVEKVVSRLGEKVYVTIDLDVFDPSIMPSTGTPEPGGLFWYDVLALLRDIADKRRITGFDVVELCPNENNKAPDFTAAKLIYKLLSYIFGSRYGKV